MKQLHNFKRTS